jgi:hypothetical protein
MLASYLPLLLLGLLPAESWFSSSQASDRQVSHGKTAPAPRSDVGSAESCAGLRDAEVVLAEQEIRLLDRLASRTATAEERTTWKGELINGREFLENLDRAMEELRCPGG